MPAKGGPVRQITFDKRPTWGLTWTSDSREIVFSMNRGGGENLWRVSASGGEPRQITVTSQTAFYPNISRRGNRLAFTEEFGNTNIYLLEGAGSTNSRLIVNSTRDDHSPQFSPDGQRIAFASSRTGSSEIWIANRDGSAQQQVTHFNGPATGTPRWSPDGRKLAFDSRAPGSSDIFVLDLDGGKLQAVVSGNSEEFLPSWSHDGRWIYFASNRGGSRQLWKAPVTGGAPVQLTRGGGFECFESPDGRRLYYTKNRATAGIWTVPTGGGPEKPEPDLAGAGYWRSWGVSNEGVYYVWKCHAAPYPVQLFRFRDRRTITLATIAEEPLWLNSGLAFSLCGNSFLLSKLDQSVNDLIMIERFR